MPRFWDVEGAFSAEECDLLVRTIGSGGGDAAPVYGAGAGQIDRRLRDVRTLLLEPEPATAWLFERLDTLFAAAGEALARPTAPLGEPVQLLRYDVGSHFLGWHTDSGFDLTGRRQVSVSVELSAPEDHDGGCLEIVPETVGRARTLPRGGARFFASQALHRVTPVTRGTRYALVAWTGAA